MSLKAFITFAALALQPVCAVWPMPREMSTGNKTLFLAKNIKVTYNGESVAWNSGNNPVILSNNTTPRIRSRIVENAIPRAMTTIFDHGLVPWMLNRPDSNWEPSLDSGDGTVSTLHITQTNDTDDANPVIGSIDESYSLSLSASGEATIKANSHIGVLHGLETFTQLFYQHSSGSKWYTKLAPISIQDEPRFPYRGIMLDTGRNFYPVEDIKRTIDGMAMNKMNFFHWHITETQSWPLEIPALPRLAEVGRYAPGLTYSPDDVTAVLEYGKARGVQVILEIDMPGHQIAGKAYPDVGVAVEATPWGTYCSEPPCGALRLGNNATYEFLDTLFDDLLPRLKPYAAYFHTGGDEYYAKNSELDPKIKTANMGTLRPLLQDFLDHAHGAVHKHGLIPMSWEEMVSEWGAKLSEDVLLQVWKGPASVKKYAKAGYKVIDSNYKVYYLDCGRGAWVDEASSPYLDWCHPMSPWPLIYKYDSLQGLSKKEAKNVLGGSLSIWSESIDAQTKDTLTWPRACAAAENWWYGRLKELSLVRPRLSEQRARMLARKVSVAALTTTFCEQNPYGTCTR
ncbi:glycoside hydrolase family 20 [Purpureocillium lilacinum]|uniref:Beta-hexosaminidase n=1 Tax=Purpureocillium lilacinum TaxID=33203 RepID=A0A179GFL8_PURLI|nr:glycoside hydrolase family 20 [Purpureocillium lilacinum]